MSTGCQKDRQRDRQTATQTDRQTDRKTERKTETFFSLLIKTKVVQNVNWMSERQKDRQKYRQTDRRTDRLTERQIQDRKTFQLSYQNKSCSECQWEVRKIETWKDRPTDRQKTERLFSLFIKTKVIKKVNRMSERQKDRQIERQKDFSAQLSEQKLLRM